EIASEPLYQRLLAGKQNRLAWFLAVCPEPRLRDPKQAVELARRAVDADPLNGGYLETLGAAHFPAGSWVECEQALTKSMQLRRGGDGFDWVFLAMACYHMGKVGEADRWLDRAGEWLAAIEQGKFTSVGLSAVRSRTAIAHSAAWAWASPR